MVKKSIFPKSFKNMLGMFLHQWIDSQYVFSHDFAQFSKLPKRVFGVIIRKKQCKKENIWNSKNIIKIVPKIFYITLDTYNCFQHVSDISGNLQKQYYVPNADEKIYIGTNVTELRFFGTRYRTSPKIRFTIYSTKSKKIFYKACRDPRMWYHRIKILYSCSATSN